MSRTLQSPNQIIVNFRMAEICFDVVIISAGVSRMNAAHRMQTGFPNLTYVILEAREAMGGT